MFESLKDNLAHEKKIIADIRSVYEHLQKEPEKKEEYMKSIVSMVQQLYMLNKTVPELLKEWSPVLKNTKIPAKPLPTIDSKVPEKKEDKDSKTVKMSYVSPSSSEKHFVTIDKNDRKEYLKKLNLSESALIGLNRKKEQVRETSEIKPNKYASLSSRYFRKYVDKVAPKFDSLASDLKKGNVPFLLSSYLSMAVLTSVIAFGVGLLIFVLMMVFSLSNIIYFWIPFGLAGLVLVGFYLYPASEASSVQKNIAYELPFATIHMAAIAGSDIEPTRIFKIIAGSKEYVNIGNEMKKIIAQTDLYGYDLVTALKNVAKRTPSKPLAELFSGLATNISTGGQLKNFLEKKAENYLLDYKLEREKYSELAGTFMDVYISILIAAPLVLMMMFIVMNVAGMSLGGLGINVLMVLSIVGIAIVNVIFIVVLNMKQPRV